MMRARGPRLTWPRGGAAALLSVATAVLGPAAASPASAMPAAPAACQPWAGAPFAGDPTPTGWFGLAVLSPCDAWVTGSTAAQIGGGEVDVTRIEHWNGAVWTVVPSPSPGTAENTLDSVSGVASNDVWAVGTASGNDSPNQNLIEHWDGNAWTVVPSPDPGSQFDQVNSVHAISANDVWAVGSFDNGTGSQTMILHWDGSSWTQVGGTQPGDLDSVTATASNDVWAVGFDNTRSPGTNLAEHWNGTSWTQVPMPTPGGIVGVNSVTATSPADAWAVGEVTGPNGSQTMALHWDGTAWTQVPTPSPDSGGQFTENVLDQVTATSASNAWAVGEYALNGDNEQRRNLILHWDGTSWTQVTINNPGATNRLNAVVSGPAGDMWALGMAGDAGGEQTSGLVIHESPAAGGCAAVAGAPPPSPGTAGGDLRAVATLSGCDAWAVGSAASPGVPEQTVIEHWDGSLWTVLPSPDVAGVNNFLSGVSALSPTDAWAVGFSQNSSAVKQPLIEHWDGTAWTIVPGPSPTARGSALNAVREVSPTDVWAVGSLTTATSSKTLILHWNGTAWTRVTSPSPGTAGVLAGMAATSATDVWAVGSFFSGTNQPLALHWTGSTWTRSRIAGSIAGSLASVSAVSASAAWAVGAQNTAAGNGTLTAFWNGRNWRAVASPNPGVTSRLFGVAASAPNNAWAVGVVTTPTVNQTLILHWTGGSTWAAVPDPGPDGGTLFAAAGTSAGNIWAVGGLVSTTRNQNLILHCC